MEIAKVTSKGQITIPISIRKSLGLREGDKVLFVEQEGSVLMLNSTVSALRQAQEAFVGEAERAGLRDEEDVVRMMSAFRRERYDENHGFGGIPMDYKLLCAQLRGFAEADGWYVPLMANAAALLYDSMADLNWAGFYLMRGGKLVLGPFQGKVACIHIPVGKGVCGTAVAEDRTQLVANVHDFPGHIACDSASNSEIVVPIHRDGRVVGVLDIDSPTLNRFTEDDRAGLEAFVRVLEERLQGDWEA